MPKRLKFVIKQCVLFMVRRQMWQVRLFKMFESARHFRIESGRPIRIRISKLRRSLMCGIIHIVSNKTKRSTFFCATLYNGIRVTE